MSANNFPNNPKTRRENILRAIEAIRAAGKVGITTSSIADELLVSVTAAKEYVRAMTVGKIIKSTSKKMPYGYKANFAVLIANQAQIDSFMASDLIAKKVVARRSRAVIKAPDSMPANFPTIQLASGRMARVYADLPLDFFRPSPAI